MGEIVALLHYSHIQRGYQGEAFSPTSRARVDNGLSKANGNDRSALQDTTAELLVILVEYE